MIEYDYTATSNSPNLDSIESETTSSTMINKSLNYMVWRQEEMKLRCYFDFALDIHDKPLFDAIVAQNL